MEEDFPDFEFNDEPDRDIVIQNYKRSFISIYDEVLYPAGIACYSEEAFQSFSLLRFCCVKITRDAKLLERVLSNIPINRYDLLIKTAICNDFRDSAAVLMSNWPSRSMSSFVIDSNALLQFAIWNVNDVSSVSSLAERLMLILALFFDAIKNDSAISLRNLDLRRVPMSDLMTNYLIRKIVSFSREVSRSDEYQIIIDCQILSNCTMQLLTSFQKLRAKFNPSLRINSIDVCQLDEDICGKLLQQIDPTDLAGLRLRQDFSPDFYKFVFNKFKTITSLNIPYIQTKVSEPLPFHLIPDLRRLGYVIGLNRLSCEIPTSTLRQLQYLNLGGRSLPYMIKDDFECLMKSPLRLRGLDLSGRAMIIEHLTTWRIFLLSLAPSLETLDLKRCSVNDDLLPSLTSFILPLVNLRYLNLGENLVSSKVCREYLPKLWTMPNMKAMRVDFPGEVKEDFSEMMRTNAAHGKACSIFKVVGSSSEIIN